MVKIKHIILLVAILMVVVSVNGVYAFELGETYYDYVEVPTVNYVPHGVQGLGDADLTPSLPAVFAWMNDNQSEFSQQSRLYSVTFNRNVAVRFSSSVRDDFNEGVRSMQVVFDWYVTTSSRRVVVYLFDSLGQLISQNVYGTSVVFHAITYVLADTPYQQGFNDGELQGFNDGYGVGFGDGEVQGFDDGYSVGFTDGFESTSDGGMWGVLWSAILAPFMVLNTEMLPGITLAMIVAVPLVFGLLGWILSTGKSRK